MDTLPGPGQRDAVPASEAWGDSAAVLSRLRALLPAIAARAAALDAAGGVEPPAADVAALAADVAALAGAGVLLAPVATALGGLGWGCEPSGGGAVFEALRLVGRASLPLGRLFEGHVNTLRLVMRHGTDRQRAAAADDARDGLLFGVWNTEAPGESLLLHPDGRGGEALRGRKILCSGAGLVRRALVTARRPDDGRQRMLLVPLPPGPERVDLSRWTPSGMRASATGSVDFSGLDASGDVPLGGPDDYLRQPGFSAGAWRFLAVHLGGAEALAEELRRHLRRTGRGEDTQQRARLGQVLAAAETARLWVREAAALAEGESAPPERVTAYVDLARGAVERAALEVLEAVQRSVGLQAFLAPHPIDRIGRDLATYLRQPAPDRALTGAAATALALDGAVGDLWPDPRGLAAADPRGLAAAGPARA